MDAETLFTITNNVDDMVYVTCQKCKLDKGLEDLGQVKIGEDLYGSKYQCCSCNHIFIFSSAITYNNGYVGMDYEVK